MASNGNFQGREVVIVEAARTPIGRGHEEKGYYKGTHPSTLLATTYKELIDRAGIEASEVEDLVTGCVQQFGEQGRGMDVLVVALLLVPAADRRSGRLDDDYLATLEVAVARHLGSASVRR